VHATCNRAPPPEFTQTHNPPFFFFSPSLSRFPLFFYRLRDRLQHLHVLPFLSSLSMFYVLRWPFHLPLSLGLAISFFSFPGIVLLLLSSPSFLTKFLAVLAPSRRSFTSRCDDLFSFLFIPTFLFPLLDASPPPLRLDFCNQKQSFLNAVTSPFFFPLLLK